ncbi:MAG TPA: ABC transporter ATP-binding protein [Armatimonadota bacterium]
MSTAIEFADVSCRIKRHQILQRISFTTNVGEIDGVLGPNGAGKTTLLSLVCGLRTRFDGEISVLGERLPRHGGALRRRIGVVLQETALYEELTTEENLRFAASLYAVPRTRERIAEVLELLQLTDRARQVVRTLSGGLRRRVAIARALLHDPELLVIDEPTLGVDVEARHAIWAHLRLLKSQGRTIIVATNYLDEALALCDTVMVLRGGVLLAREAPSALIERTGYCLDITCVDTMVNELADTITGMAQVLFIERTPSGLSVFLNSDTAPEPIMRAVMDHTTVDGFRLRAPDLAEIFSALDEPQ